MKKHYNGFKSDRQKHQEDAYFEHLYCEELDRDSNDSLQN
jgi:hypothetical protein